MKYFKTASAIALALSSSALMAQELEIKFTNLTQGIYFTPVGVVAHSPDASLFEVGEAASAEIQAMAEGGSLAGITTIADSVGADMLAETAAGPLGPTKSVSGNLMTADGNTVLSIVAMVLPSNDGFVGLDSGNPLEKILFQQDFF